MEVKKQRPRNYGCGLSNPFQAGITEDNARKIRDIQQKIQEREQTILTLKQRTETLKQKLRVLQNMSVKQTKRFQPKKDDNAILNALPNMFYTLAKAIEKNIEAHDNLLNDAISIQKLQVPNEQNIASFDSTYKIPIANYLAEIRTEQPKVDTELTRLENYAKTLKDSVDVSMIINELHAEWRSAFTSEKTRITAGINQYRQGRLSITDFYWMSYNPISQYNSRKNAMQTFVSTVSLMRKDGGTYGNPVGPVAILNTIRGRFNSGR